MGKHKSCWSLCITDLYMCIVVAAIFFPSCAEARKSIYAFIGTTSVNSRNSDISAATTIKQIKTLNRIDIDMPLDSSNTQPSGVSSPISLPPYDSLPPTPLPQNAPPFCLYPPFTPQPPSATGGGGGGYSPLVPPPPTPMSSAPIVNPPPPSQAGSVPPSGTVPSPSISTSPPGSSVASPPTSNVPSPWGLIPSPPVFLPPIVYPKPAVPPPPNVTPSTALWCVANPSVPEPIIQEAMNYACGSGADCAQIQPNGACFQPDTLLAHASYAFNSYWQRTKAAGGTCEFGGTAMLVTVDPSYDDCHFMYN